jgi:hypothetical protein
MQLIPAPAFIVTGGDLCHNLRDQTLDQCVAMAELFTKLWSQQVSVPSYHCLGNHDAAGWGKGLASFPGGSAHPRRGQGRAGWVAPGLRAGDAQPHGADRRYRHRAGTGHLERAHSPA